MSAGHWYDVGSLLADVKTVVSSMAKTAVLLVKEVLQQACHQQETIKAHSDQIRWCGAVGAWNCHSIVRVCDMLIGLSKG